MVKIENLTAQLCYRAHLKMRESGAIFVICATLLVPGPASSSDQAATLTQETLSREDATRRAEQFFDTEIMIEGGLGNPSVNGAFWSFPVRLGYAGEVQPDPILVHRHTGQVSWAGLAALNRERQELAESQSADQMRAWQLCQHLNGYKRFRKSFEVDNVLVGSINGFPESLQCTVRTTNSGLLNAGWWWDPLTDKGDPKYDWNTFLRVYEAASKVIAKHSWLSEWKEASPGRLAELHIFGDGIGETASDLESFILPVWREAGLAGDPEYSLLARRDGRSGWAQLYFGTKDQRALVTEVQQPEASPTHWLDGLSVSYHPRCKPDDRSSRYVVVDPSGRWELRTVRACQP